jgi:hypothetical protein
MARRVFFSFQYEDVARVMVVRNSWVFQGNESAGFIDKAEFEEVQRKGEQSIRNWINNQLEGTSVTVVLIGSNTSKSQWVKYEIEQSIKRDNGLLGIYIHQINGLGFGTTFKGENPLENHQITIIGRPFSYKASNYYQTYDWLINEGYDNLGKWIEEAAQKAGR